MILKYLNATSEARRNHDVTPYSENNLEWHDKGAPLVRARHALVLSVEYHGLISDVTVCLN